MKTSTGKWLLAETVKLGYLVDAANSPIGWYTTEVSQFGHRILSQKKKEESLNKMLTVLLAS